MSTLRTILLSSPMLALSLVQAADISISPERNLYKPRDIQQYIQKIEENDAKLNSLSESSNQFKKHVKEGLKKLIEKLSSLQTLSNENREEIKSLLEALGSDMLKSDLDLTSYFSCLNKAKEIVKNTFLEKIQTDSSEEEIARLEEEKLKLEQMKLTLKQNVADSNEKRGCDLDFLSDAKASLETFNAQLKAESEKIRSESQIIKEEYKAEERFLHSDLVILDDLYDEAERIIEDSTLLTDSQKFRGRQASQARDFDLLNSIMAEIGNDPSNDRYSASPVRPNTVQQGIPSPASPLVPGVVVLGNDSSPPARLPDKSASVIASDVNVQQALFSSQPTDEAKDQSVRSTSKKRGGRRGVKQ